MSWIPNEERAMLSDSAQAFLRERAPVAHLRALRIEMYWDGAPTPAVSAPLGDFFGVGLGRKTPFENALFSDPDARVVGIWKNANPELAAKKSK